MSAKATTTVSISPAATAAFNASKVSIPGMGLLDGGVAGTVAYRRGIVETRGAVAVRRGGGVAVTRSGESFFPVS